MRYHRMNKGFTLMEVLIVVAIIAILLSIAIPIVRGNLAKAQLTACKANRRSLYGEILSDYFLSNRPFSELFDEFVRHAGKCPCGGTFSWQDDGDTGIIKCS